MDPEEVAEVVEEVESEQTPEVEVTVTVPETEEEPMEVTNEGDTIVTVEAPEEPEATVTEGELDRWLDFQRQLDDMNGRLDAMAAVQVATVEAASEAVEEVHEEVGTVEALVTEAEAEDAREAEEESIEPASARVHPLFRTREQWKEARS